MSGEPDRCVTVRRIIQGRKVFGDTQPDLYLARAETDAGDIMIPALNFPLRSDAAVQPGDTIEIKGNLATVRREDGTIMWLLA